jgi:copper chaperone
MTDSKNPERNDMTENYIVSGMTCEGCSRSVTKAIETAIPGAKVAVDLTAGRVSVEGGEASQVAQAVEDAGFDYGGPA